MKFIRLIWFLATIMLLAACSDEAPTPTITAPAGEEPVPAATTPESTPAATAAADAAATATSRPTATPSPSPAPPAPTISIADQPLATDGLLIVERVITLAPGWVVVYTDEDGAPSEILGFTPVSTGESNDVTVEIDPYLATPQLHLLLHADEGQPKEFEFPGLDDPFRDDQGPVSTTFTVEIDVLVPELNVADQEVDTEGQVVINRVVSDGPGWIAIHADQAGEPGPIIGQTPLMAGENQGVVVSFNWREATPQLHAVLYTDDGEMGIFEAPNPDRPVLVSGIPVRVAFGVTLPPDVFVLNQPIVNDQVVIERVLVNGPAWLTIFTDVDGQPNLIIGQSLLESGVNTGIVVPVDGSAATPILHVVLYEDNEPIGEYNFPGNDQAIRYQGRLQTYSFRTDAGNYLITNDQPFSADNSVLVPLVVNEIPAWVVVQAEEDGAPGAVLGWTWIPAGVHRGIVIELDPDQVTDTLYVALIQDAGVEQEFEYPDGLDIPLQRNRAPIVAPFLILPAEETANE
jgi:hypothetical protein